MRRKKQKEERSSKEEADRTEKRFVPIPPAKNVETRQAKQEVLESTSIPPAEDGEISSTSAGSCTPPPLVFKPGPPPTQPRSFNASPSPSNVVVQPVVASGGRRPPPMFRLPACIPTGTPAPSTSTSTAHRPLPSGPRALRAVNSGSMSMSIGLGAPMQTQAAAAAAAPAAPPYRSFSGGQFIPRRPSADRDWERERAWQQGQQRGSRVRGPGPGSGWR